MRMNALSLTALLSLAPIASAQLVATNPTGGSQAFENRQPCLAMHYVVQTQGLFGIGVPVRLFAYSNPTMASLASSSGSGGWVPADGRSLPISTNQALYAQLGTNYGGDGFNVFNIPDLRSRVVLGEGSQGAYSYVSGQMFGSATTTLVTANLPPHAHTEVDSLNGFTSITGSGLQVDTMQPALVLRNSIAVTGIYPCRDCGPDAGIGNGPSDPYLSQLFVHAATPTSAPNTYGLADGSLRAIQTNSALFSLLGVNFGGNGVQTFGVPDLRGRLACYYGVAPGLGTTSIGAPFGTPTVQLVTSSLPLHNHTVGSGGGILTPTGFVGASPPAPLPTQQPTLPVSYFIVVSGVYPSSSGMADDVGYIGEVIAMANNFAPGGCVPCDGRLLLRSAYSALFSLIGTTYGAGDGSTSFAVPDLRGRVPIGASLTSIPGALLAGTQVGVQQVTLSTAQMPSHTHTFTRLCPADIGVQGGLPGHDGVRDNNDFVVFINDFFAHDPVADMGRQGGLQGADGLYDNNDFVAFIDRFFTVCP